MDRKRPLRMLLAPCLACALHPVSLPAAGFALTQQGASGLGNSFAGGAAYSEDASAICFNPAAMSDFAKSRFDLGGQLTYSAFEFSNLGSSIAAGGSDDGGQTLGTLTFYYLEPLSEDLHFGFGLFSPFGVKTQYNDTWVGRYHALQTSLATLDINPSLSLRLTDKLAVGAGFNAQYASITLSNAIDFGSLCLLEQDAAACQQANLLPQQSDGLATLSADDSTLPAFAFNWGVLFKPAPHTRLAAAYRAQINHKLKGRAEYTVPEAAAFMVSGNRYRDSSIRGNITLPPQFSLSAYHGSDARLAIMADFTWTGWESFDELRFTHRSGQSDTVNSENWRNSYRLSLGFNFRVADWLLLRTGTAFDKSPIADDAQRTARIPDNDRTWLSLGCRFNFTPNLGLDIAYARLHMRDGAVVAGNADTNSATADTTLTGKFTMRQNIISSQLAWQFD